MKTKLIGKIELKFKFKAFRFKLTVIVFNPLIQLLKSLSK